MKKNLFMVAAVALLALVSCNKEEINNGGVEPQEPQTPSVTVQFTASLEATKTSLDVENKKTVWLETDKISINGQEFEIKDIQEDGKAIFVNVNTLPEGFGAPFTAVYPYGSNGVPASQTAYANNFDPAAVIETATSEDYSLHFSNESSLLKFQVPANCKSVTLSADEELAKGSNTVTISGSMEADTDYYVAVLPGTKTNFVVRIDGYLSKDANSVTIGESAIVNMKSLPAPVVSTKYGIAGTFQSPTTWDASNPIEMYNDIDGKVIINNVELYKDDAFKVVVDKSWDESYGNGGANMTVEKNGIFDIVFDSETNEITATCIEEYTDVKVILTVKNERTNWGSVYMHLWKENGEEDEDITIWPGASLSADSQGNYTYELDGKYISENIGFIFSDNGADQTNEDYITVSRKGHNLTIASMPPAKFYFVLDTDNSKQWWGTTAYLHMWTSDGDLFGGWPGKLMTYDGDYKFSCDIPAEYIGTKVNFKVHNGNGWEGANQINKTIAAEQTYNGSSIGIN